MQPTFNPWIGYFDLIDYVDTFVFLDTVQLNQQSWQTRNKLKIQNKELLFSLPIQQTNSKSNLLIKDAFLDFGKFDFRKKLFRTLEQNHKKSRYFLEVNELIKSIVLFETKLLSEYNINIITQISKHLGIDTNIITLSKTEYATTSKKGNLVLDIAKYFDSNKYISPLGSKEYLEKVEMNFNKENIEIEYQYYKHPVYQQLGDKFLPYIGIFDLLYNEGLENSLKIIREGRSYENR